MTDLLEQREVTTSPVEAALRIPFDPSMCTKVARFGFEYEMLPHDYDDDDYDDDIYVDTDEVWSDDHSVCNCTDCIDERIDARRDEIAAERRRDREQRGGDAYDLIRAAKAANLIRDQYKHDYHCHCDSCSPTRRTHLLTAQSDCSVGVEFVSRICDLNRDDWDATRDQINLWIATMKKWADSGGWMPDGRESCGNHVHVSKSGADGGDAPFTHDQTLQAAAHINALYAAFDWTDVADGGTGRIRDYNRKPHKDSGGGSWLSDRGYGTQEHRLWNTPADPDRLWAHLGISIGLTRWAFALAVADPDFTFWREHDQWGNGRMDDDTFVALNNNIERVIEAVSDYIPARPEFNLAHEVLGNLARL